MDALLSAFLVCLLCEFGGSTQRLALALAQRFRRDAAILIGILCAALANAALSSIAGRYVAASIGPDARSLLLAVALLSAGVGMIFKGRKPDLLDNWRTNAFTTALLGAFILGFGDSAQFMIFGIVTKMADPAMAVIGGALGTVFACLPVVVLRKAIAGPRVTMALRRTGAVIFITTGAILGLTATKLL